MRCIGIAELQCDLRDRETMRLEKAHGTVAPMEAQGAKEAAA
jgi:hypothetical protein